MIRSQSMAGGLLGNEGDEMKTNSRKWYETYTLGIVAIGGIIISILDFFGLIGNLSFFPSITQLSLLLLGNIRN
jgi:hypothetical protein